jgi:hypothetical protein
LGNISRDSGNISKRFLITSNGTASATMLKLRTAAVLSPISLGQWEPRVISFSHKTC